MVPEPRRAGRSEQSYVLELKVQRRACRRLNALLTKLAKVKQELPRIATVIASMIGPDSVAPISQHFTTPR